LGKVIKACSRRKILLYKVFPAPRFFVAVINLPKLFLLSLRYAIITAAVFADFLWRRHPYYKGLKKRQIFLPSAGSFGFLCCSVRVSCF